MFSSAEMKRKLARIQAANKAAASKIGASKDTQELQEPKEIASASEQARAQANAPAPATTPTQPTQEHIPASDWQWHENQLQAIELARQLKAFCLIGAAGTGKTTVQVETVRNFMVSLPYRISQDCPSRHLRAGNPAIAIISFTNRAVRVIYKALAKNPDIANILPHVLTYHKLLEYRPTKETVWSEEKGEYIERKIFLPTFDASNPLNDLKLVIIEESSMISIDQFYTIREACPNAQFVFLGDLNQLNPIFGDPILGVQLNYLPVVELTKVYRQAMDSPIIAFQHNFTLKGKVPSDTDLQKITEQDKGLKFMPLKGEKQYPDIRLAQIVANYMKREYDAGRYDPEGDHQILCPQNVGFGSILINQYIAQWLDGYRNNLVYEILGGINKRYFAINDLVIFDKKEYKIVAIEPNPRYTGTLPQPESRYLMRSGTYNPNMPADEKARIKNIKDTGFLDFGSSKEQIEKILKESFIEGSHTEDEEKDNKNQISHILQLEPIDSEDLVTSDIGINSRGDLNKLDFKYCISVHKSQGSEWEKVWLIIVNTHARMLSRELLYTGMTRTREDLTVIYSPQTLPGKKNNSIAKAIKQQRIPGETWQAKAKFLSDKHQLHKYPNALPSSLGKQEQPTE
jgi:hypothetical protein